LLSLKELQEISFISFEHQIFLCINILWEQL
jgi:hypothetical protein